mgnify:CR=1 FL=1
MTDKAVDHIIKQNETLLQAVLRGGTPPAPVDTTVDELEQELAEANKTITTLKTEHRDYEKLRDTLFKERDDNHEQVTALKTQLDLAETRNANLAQQIAEYEAQEAQVVQRFKQLQAELETAQANTTDLTRTDRANTLRLINNALEKFDDDPDAAFANLNRAKTTLTQNH